MDRASVDSWFADIPWIDRQDIDVKTIASKIGDDYGMDLVSKLVEWRENGIVVFEKAVSPELIDALIDDIDYLKRHHQDFELDVELRGEIKKIASYSRDDLEMDGIKFNSIHSISRAAALLSLNREVMIFLRSVFEDAPAVLQSLTFFRGSQQPIHIDYPYVRTQTKLAHLAASWVALEDIHEDSGPLAYYPGSHKPEVSGFFDWGGGNILYNGDSARTPVEFAEYLAARVHEQKVRSKVYCPKKGDVLIWHGNLAHEGTGIRNQALTRKSYVTHYTSLSAYPADFSIDGVSKRVECGDISQPCDGAGYIQRWGGLVFDYPWLSGIQKLPSFR